MAELAYGPRDGAPLSVRRSIGPPAVLGFDGHDVFSVDLGNGHGVSNPVDQPPFRANRSLPVSVVRPQPVGRRSRSGSTVSRSAARPIDGPTYRPQSCPEEVPIGHSAPLRSLFSAVRLDRFTRWLDTMSSGGEDRVGKAWVHVVTLVASLVCGVRCFQDGPLTMCGRDGIDLSLTCQAPGSGAWFWIGPDGREHHLAAINSSKRSYEFQTDGLRCMMDNYLSSTNQTHSSLRIWGVRATSVPAFLCRIGEDNETFLTPFTDGIVEITFAARETQIRCHKRRLEGPRTDVRPASPGDPVDQIMYLEEGEYAGRWYPREGLEEIGPGPRRPSALRVEGDRVTVPISFGPDRIWSRGRYPLCFECLVFLSRDPIRWSYASVTFCPRSKYPTPQYRSVDPSVQLLIGGLAAVALIVSLWSVVRARQILAAVQQMRRRWSEPTTFGFRLGDRLLP